MRSLKSAFVLLLFGLMMGLPTAGTALAEGGVVWQAEYYANPSLNGKPVQVVREAQINHNWGRRAPLDGVPADRFSVYWSTTAELKGGRYTFVLTVDDGARLWVDDKLVIDAWNVQAAKTYRSDVTLSDGPHNIELIYFEDAGEAVAQLHWQMAGGQMPQPPQQPGPRPPQQPQPGERMIIDNDSPAFTWGGPGKYRHTEQGGHGNSFYWTYNNTTEPDNYGQWTPSFPQGGSYEVLVFVPSHHATSSKVRYRIMIEGVRHDKIIDQLAHSNEWVSLGVYKFNGRNQGKEYIVAYDNTRESLNSTMIAFDALMLVPQERR